MDVPSVHQPSPDFRAIRRRTLASTAVWATPVVAISVMAPAVAASACPSCPELTPFPSSGSLTADAGAIIDGWTLVYGIDSELTAGQMWDVSRGGGGFASDERDDYFHWTRDTRDDFSGNAFVRLRHEICFCPGDAISITIPWRRYDGNPRPIRVQLYIRVQTDGGETQVGVAVPRSGNEDRFITGMSELTYTFTGTEPECLWFDLRIIAEGGGNTDGADDVDIYSPVVSCST